MLQGRPTPGPRWAHSPVPEAAPAQPCSQVSSAQPTPTPAPCWTAVFLQTFSIHSHGALAQEAEPMGSPSADLRFRLTAQVSVGEAVSGALGACMCPPWAPDTAQHP